MVLYISRRATNFFPPKPTFVSELLGSYQRWARRSIFPGDWSEADMIDPLSSHSLSSVDIFQHHLRSSMLLIDSTKSRMLLIQLLYAAYIKYSLPLTWHVVLDSLIKSSSNRPRSSCHSLVYFQLRSSLIYPTPFGHSIVLLWRRT